MIFDKIALRSYASAVLIIIGFYAWECSHCGLTGWDWIVNHNGGAYGQLTTAFTNGHLYLAPVPDPKLAQVADPYTPINRLPGTLVLWDYGYYRAPGDVPRYYLYFGPAPAIIFYLPFVLCGWMPSSILISFIISCLNVFLFSYLLRYLVVFFFKNIPVHLQFLSLLVYGFSNLFPEDIPAARVYEIAILAGTTFTLGFFIFLIRSINSTGTRIHLNLFAAGTFGGLAMSSKVTDAFLCFILALGWVGLLVAFRASNKGGWIKFGLTSILSAFIPFTFFVIALLSYNEERFGNPFEFGTRYSLNGGDCLRSFFQPEYIPEGLLDYYVAPITIVGAFPYVHPSYEPHLAPIEPPLFQINALHSSSRGIEDYLGILFSFPICVCALFWYRNLCLISHSSIRIPMIYFGCLISLWWLLITGIYSLFNFVAIRYETEFQLPILLLTLVSVLAKYHANKVSFMIRCLTSLGLVRLYRKRLLGLHPKPNLLSVSLLLVNAQLAKLSDNGNNTCQIKFR